MEAAIANLLEPGDKIIVGNAGIWGERVADLSARYGGRYCHCCRPTVECNSYHRVWQKHS
jgi:alanine-glyoxylate transaminase/serine-glyoxylate transaminase/serine-pyruvate transaminase